MEAAGDGDKDMEDDGDIAEERNFQEGDSEIDAEEARQAVI